MRERNSSTHQSLKESTVSSQRCDRNRSRRELSSRIRKERRSHILQRVRRVGGGQ